MNTRELVATAARQSGMTQVQAREALDAFLEAIAEALSSGDPVTLAWFGRFELKDYTGRPIRHPRTRDVYQTQSRQRPSFHPYPALKRRIEEGNGGRE
jgi:DNA-binding protein HU-beta